MKAQRTATQRAREAAAIDAERRQAAQFGPDGYLRDGVCVICGERIAMDDGWRRVDVLDGNGFGQMNAPIHSWCEGDLE